MDKIITRGMQFVDDLGRIRIFNGMNIDDKHRDQERFFYNLDEDFFKKYRSNGFDIIRLAITWQNLEPRIREYNKSYLKSIDDIFTLAEKYGVYILLDMHQDLFSGNDGKSCGDGAPDWAALTDGAKPRQPIFVWADGYFFGRWVSKSFDNFWNNTPVGGVGLQDRYCDLWRMLAKRYGDSPALFGYDLMNEPFPGSLSRRIFVRLILSAAKELLTNEGVDRATLAKAIFKRDTRAILDSLDASIIRDIMKRIDSLEEEFDKKYYSPFLNKTTAAIREITPNGIVMMEQSYICNSGVKQSAPAITVNGKREPLQCFGPHAYDMTVDTPLYQYANAARVKAFFTEMYNTQVRLNVPCIVGEWGGCSDNTDTSWFPHAYELLEFFDEKQWGQMYWDYHGDDMNAPLMKMLSRAHPVAVAGKPEHYGYDVKTKEFSLRFYADGKGETLIYVHKPFDADGIEFSTLEEYENGASLISIKAEAGEHTVKLKIK